MLLGYCQQVRIFFLLSILMSLVPSCLPVNATPADTLNLKHTYLSFSNLTILIWTLVLLQMVANTCLSEAELLAERIRSVAEKIELSVGVEGVNFIVSVGLQSCESQHDDLDAVTNRAYDPLYHAKRLGRNRVIITT